MKIGINDDKRVLMDMRLQLKQVVEEFEKYDTVDDNVTTPASQYLCNVTT